MSPDISGRDEGVRTCPQHKKFKEVAPSSEDYMAEAAMSNCRAVKRVSGRIKHTGT